MDPPRRCGQILHHVTERAAQCGAAPDQYVIMAGLQRPCAGQSHHFTQAAPHTVALHGIADLPRDGESHAHCVSIGAAARLQQKGGRRRPHRAGGCPKINPALQPLHGTRAWLRRLKTRTSLGRRDPLTHSGACDRERAALRRPCGRLWLPCGRESRGGACAPICSADRSVSRKSSPLALENGRCARFARRLRRRRGVPRLADRVRRRAIAPAYTGPLRRRQIRPHSAAADCPTIASPGRGRYG
jgi:hypothetical protein